MNMEPLTNRIDYLRQPLPQFCRARLQAGGTAGRGFAAIILPRNYTGTLKFATVSGYLADDANAAQIKLCTQLGAEFYRADVRTIGSPGVSDLPPVTPPNPAGIGAEALCFASSPLNHPAYIDRVIPDSSGVFIYYETDSAQVSTIDVTLVFDLEISEAV